MGPAGHGLSRFLQSRLFYALPFVISFVYMLAFSTLDGYEYPLSACDDQGLFQRIALNLLKNGVFSGSLGSKTFFCPTRPPLYPFILAMTWKITGSTSLVPIRLIQGISYLFSIYFIYRIATTVTEGDRRYGALSALVASLIPFGAAATHVVLTESLALFFLSLSVLLAVRFRTKPVPCLSLLLGISLALLVLQRPTFVLIPSVLFCYILFSPKVAAKNLLSLMLPLVLSFSVVLAPWTLYKLSESGSCSPVYATGFVLMQGIADNNPSLRENLLRHWSYSADVTADGKSLRERLDTFLRAEKELTAGDIATLPDTWKLIDLTAATYLQAWQTEPPSAQAVIQSDSFLKKMAFIWMKNHPWQYAAVVAANVRTLLFGSYQPLIHHAIGGYLYLYTAAVKWGLYLLSFAGTLILVLQRRFHVVFFPLTIFFYLIIVHSMMHTEPRYFMYAYTFMPMTVPVLVLGRSPKKTDE